MDRLYERVRERGQGLDVLFANAGINPIATPGPVNTRLWDEAFGERAEEMMEAVAAGLPRKRVADPDEIAAAVTFLASSDSSFVYGSNLSVDGGLNQI